MSLLAGLSQQGDSISAAVAGLEVNPSARAMVIPGLTADFLPAPSSQISPIQQRFIDTCKFGLWPCWGVPTYEGVEIGSATYPVANILPTNPNFVESWAANAVTLGADHLLVIAKHHDGFCAWHTDAVLGSAGAAKCTKQMPLGLDVVGAAATACKKHGLGLALQWSCWDKLANADTTDRSKDEELIVYGIAQLTELLTRYGEIRYIWIDGTWMKTAAQWGLARLYQTVKRLQPWCVVICNHTVKGTATEPPFWGKVPTDFAAGDALQYWPSDVRTIDPYAPKTGNPTDLLGQDPKTYIFDGQTYYLPFQAGFTIQASGKWFYTADGVAFGAGWDETRLSKSVCYGNVAVMAIPCAPSGGLPIGFANRQVTTAAHTRPAKVNCLEKCPCTASHQYNGTFYAPSRATDGLWGSDWAGVDGQASQWLEVSFLGTRKLKEISLTIPAAFLARITAMVAEVWNGAAYVEVGSFTNSAWTTEEVFSITPTIGSKLKLTFACTAGPHISELRGYE